MGIQTKQMRLFAFMLSLALTLACCYLNPGTVHAAKKLTLARSSASVAIGGTRKIQVKNAKKGARVTYKPNKTSIVSVSKKGKVKGLKAGKATIIVTVKEGKKKTKLSYKLKVKRPALSKTSLSVGIGKTVSLVVKNKPLKAARVKYKWSSTNKNIATVKNGKVTGIATGITNVRLKVTSNKKFSYTLSCKISVEDSKAGSVQTSDFDKFAREGAQLIKENNKKFETGISEGSEFSSRRLIVCSKGGGLDFSRLSPKAVVESEAGIYLVQFSSLSAAKVAFEEIKKWPEVEWVEPDVYVNVDAADNVAAGAKAKSWGVEKIGADKYASSISSIRTNIVVAVVDSGVAASHPFLKNRVKKGGYDYVDNDSDPNDGHHHGTHVAGTVVDCTPGLNVQVLPVRVLDAEGGGSSFNVGNGIKYAANHGAKVINLSLRGGHSNYIDDNIDYAIKKGVVVVAAAGNDGYNTAYFCPAHLTKAVVVAAVDKNDQRALFSNYGDSVDVAAPGVGVVSCVPGGGYKSLNGTSMAAPHVAAVAAMFRLKYPSKTPAQIETLLKNNVRDLGSPGKDRYYGHGILDLSKVKTVQPTGVALNKTSVSITVGETVTLTATVQPSNATEKTITWSSGNTSIAKVKNGVVTGVSAGTATITAKTANGKKASCTVKVAPKTIQPTGVTLNKSALTMEGGDSALLTATVAPANASNKTLTWSSGEPSIAEVNNGKVTGKSPGTVTVTAQTVNGKKATCTVTVKAKSVWPTDVSLNRSDLTLEKGSEALLTAAVSPSNATDKTVTWASDRPSIAKVSDGRVTGISPGRATITATTVNGKQAACTVEVTVSPTGISLSKSSITIKTAQAFTLTATVFPNDVTDKSITWTSDHPSVAKVSDGTVTGVSAGMTTIEASTANGKTASCRVTVEEIFPESISVTVPGQVSPLCMGIGERMALNAAVQPAGAVQATVTWSSSNSSVAVVDSQGIVTGMAEGAVTITAATQNGVKGSCSIRVKPAVVKAEEITYKETLGGDLIVDAVIYLKDPPALNGNKYILYYAYKNGYRWEEIGSYNIDGKCYFENRWDCDAKVNGYRIEGRKIKVQLLFNTAGLQKMSNNMFAISLFPFNNFTSGASLHDVYILVTLN